MLRRLALFGACALLSLPACAPPPAQPAAFPGSPVRARFVTSFPLRLDPAPCSDIFVAVDQGAVEVAGHALGDGDVALLRRAGPVEVRGRGLALVAEVELPKGGCGRDGATRVDVVRGRATPRLVWAGGSMSAQLDVGREVSPEAYLGRLSGTAGVPEHAHEGSWEILFAIEASGVLTLDGADRRVERGQIVYVPAGAKHAWSPDPGTKLRAVQMYVPAGPEQRFKVLAAAAR